MLDGHAGYGAAISGDGNTIAIGAPHESSSAKGINGNQNDTSVYDAGRGLRVHPQRRDVDAAGLRQGVQSRARATVRPCRRAERRRQHDGGRGVLGGQQRQGHQRQPGRRFDPAGRRGVRVHAPRHDWTQQAYIKARTPARPAPRTTFGDGDQFGFSLALSDDGNTLAVGAIAEDSNATGINGNQADNSAMSAGAVYVFTRTGTPGRSRRTSSRRTLIAATMFGYTVSLSADGSTLAVGSLRRRRLVARRSTARPTTCARGSGARLRVHAHRRRVGTAGLHQGVQRRGRRFVRRDRSR